MTKSEEEEFENLDKLFFRRLLEVPTTTPVEAYYLELGVLLISVIKLKLEELTIRIIS